MTNERNTKNVHTTALDRVIIGLTAVWLLAGIVASLVWAPSFAEECGREPVVGMDSAPSC